MRFFWIFITPIIVFGSIRGDLNVGLRAMQQLRTLIPERLSDEEFSIIVDQKAFAERHKTYSNSMKEEGIPAAKAIGCSHFYYSHWTIAGEPVRILDYYQEFEYGPYWLYPTAVQRLYDMHHTTTSGTSK
jgi:hypothetical protein